MTVSPPAYKEIVYSIFPDNDSVRLAGWVRSNYDVDQAAVAFFNDRTKTGVDLTPEKIKEYVVNASVLNACIALYERASTYQRIAGDTYNWEKMADAIKSLRTQLNHTLPESTLRFRKKVTAYKREGYSCLISGKFGNQSARVVDYKTECLIVSIACLPNKPFNKSVHDMYIQFVCGELDVYDPQTGEIYNPEDFTDKKGEPKIVSESTITNYLNKPKNRLIIKNALEDWSTFMHEERPHVHRHDGEYSLSQITCDDVDLTRKLSDTKKRVHAYYMYDDLSQCIIGSAYSRSKDQALIVDCFRDMFRMLDRNGLGMPAGIEVENHLMSEYRDGFLQSGVAFAFVHYCAPLNSQEKRAESLNGAKKRSIIHKNHEGIGRFYGKGKWRMSGKKISDSQNDTYEDKEYYSFEQLVADDRSDNREWNNSLHPNQKRYPKMTRWQVFISNVNPELEQLDKLTLSRYIGERVATSVRRNSTVRVNYEDWWLSSPEILEKLSPNDYKVTAYYLPDEEGKPGDVYLFQGDRYIDKVERVETYCRVMAEQTDDDIATYIDQQKRISQFDKYVRDNAVTRIGIQRPRADSYEAQEVEVLPPVDTSPPDYYVPEADYTRRALEDF